MELFFDGEERILCGVGLYALTSIFVEKREREDVVVVAKIQITTKTKRVMY